MAGPKRVVVVNDDPVQLRLIASVLQHAGHEVEDYVDSSKALTALADGRSVDLFLVDLHMPGIDGWKLCRLLRSPELAPYNETPILIVSATFTGADVEEITDDIGADAFLPMPFSREDMLDDVAALLGGQRPQARSSVLIIEDDDGVARALTRTFEANSYEVHRAATVAEATRLWTKVRPDVVISDYHLPDGTCVDMLQRLHSPSERTVVLVTTGDTDPALPHRLLELGADGYARKPFDPNFLVELAGKARRERSLLRVEALLEHRTQELRRSEARYRSLFDAIPDLVVTLDGNDRVVHANEEATALLGPHPEDLLGRPLADFVAPERVAQTTAALGRVRRLGYGRFESEVVGLGRQRRSVEIRATCTDESDGDGVLIVARDITERMRAEEERRRLDHQVQHAQRLESLGVLAGGIAHDFNNLLVGVMGNASLALLDTEEGSSVHQSIVQIETAARRAAELTRQILTFSGKGEATMEPQDVSCVVSEMGQLLSPAISKKAEVSYRLHPDLPKVEADASQFRQVVMNLIMNASDALGEEAGVIDVRTALRDLDEREVHDHYLGEQASAGTYVAVEVTDSGCGMDEETRRQIFDPFFTTKFAGRGLGLAATLGIVRAHGGLVWVESILGEGTTFRVLLPAVNDEDAPAGDGPARRSRSWRSVGSVLVVDDEPSVRTLATTALRRGGYRVIEAGDGRQGLDLLFEADDVDLVVLDLTMAAVDGVDVLEAVRARHPEIPVLLSSSYSADALPAGCMEDGVTGFLHKPFAPSDLVASVSRLLRANAPRGGRPAARSG